MIKIKTEELLDITIAAIFYFKGPETNKQAVKKILQTTKKLEYELIKLKHDSELFIDELPF